MYIRFVIHDANPATGDRLGIFAAAYRLREGRDLPNHVRAQISDQIDWFERNLRRPTRFNRCKSKAFMARNTRGLSWAKPTAKLYIARLREMALILDDQSHLVEMIKTHRPGYVVYEDEFQVVAEPFRDSL